jgi:hypothetical protein
LYTELLHIVYTQQPKNWAAFDAAIPADSINEPVAAAYNQIVLASGRNERSRAATETWLR